MFTGLIQAKGISLGIQDLKLRLAPVPEMTDLKLGESISIEGVCLTLVDQGDFLGFDLSQETLNRTALGQLVEGASINLERALLPTERLGGHIVQGHVDRLGKVLEIKEEKGWWLFGFFVGADGDRYLIDKGSICLNGVSLTVIEPNLGEFTVAVIPHTYHHTSLSRLKPGDPVNVEFDVLAKHVEKLLQHHQITRP
ncbi:MAG: riboflavin synthase [Fimbriimonadaceae bacterium]|jgi:riboflavin synthase|nr:riboflavin synthase [Fimbriimonadaceae bacterium]